MWWCFGRHITELVINLCAKGPRTLQPHPRGVGENSREGELPISLVFVGGRWEVHDWGCGLTGCVQVFLLLWKCTGAPLFLLKNKEETAAFASQCFLLPNTGFSHSSHLGARTFYSTSDTLWWKLKVVAYTDWSLRMCCPIKSLERRFSPFSCYNKILHVL